MAEVTSKTIQLQEPRPNSIWLAYVKGTGAANNDILTVTPFATVVGAFLIASDGTVATMTFATNVITITNAGTKVWSGLVWGS